MASQLVYFLFGILIQHSLAAEWTYFGKYGVDSWKNNYPECGKNAQSPINIYEGDATVNGITEKLVYTGYDTTEGLVMSLENDGHSAKVSLSGSVTPTISGGGLGGTFNAAQFHFHWSDEYELGSEHEINSKGYPSELHIVHWNTKYADIGTAVDKPDGLAVLGFMIEIADEDNPHYADLMAAVDKMGVKGDPGIELLEKSLNSFLPTDHQNFFRYPGSLTTPPCYESVTWTVFKETIKLSEDQLRTFFKLKDTKGQEVVYNGRHVMPLNSREVKANYDPDIKWSYTPGYNDPSKWHTFYEACGGDSQSPINIPSNAADFQPTLGNMTFSNFDTTTGITMRLINNGHTLQVNFGGPATPTVSGGGLPDTYNVAQFHFHWGSSNLKGSEHYLDAFEFPMEVHIVCYANSHGSLGAAVKKPKGLAVLGFFFDLENADNSNLDPIITKLGDVVKAGSDVQIDTMSLDSMIPADRGHFFRYDGSLTTPACYESVIWSVFDSKIPISSSQMDQLRQLTSKDKMDGIYQPLVDTHRPIQNLNTRPISANFRVPVVPAPKWSYYGATAPKYWFQSYPNCASGKRQSPIDILPREVAHKELNNFDLSGFDDVAGIKLKLENSGYGVTVNYDVGDLKVKGGDLPGTFKVAQFHFHWGSTDDQGSEHTIDGDGYPMELHVVSINELYSNPNVAFSQGNGLAVLGFLFEISDEDNNNLEPMLRYFGDIENAKSKVDIPPFALRTIMARDLTRFFRYDGSLTTPSCSESVTWSVFYDRVPISVRQLEKFRALKSSEQDALGAYLPNVDNHRHTMPLGDRTVYSNFFISGAPVINASSPILVSIVFTVTKLLWSSP